MHLPSRSDILAISAKLSIYMTDKLDSAHLNDMSDGEPKITWSQFKLVTAALVLGCAYLSWIELKYNLTGQTTTATVIRSDYYVLHRKGVSRRVALTYEFTDAVSGTRTDIDDVPLNDEDPPAVGSTIKVEYIPGSPGQSRQLGHNNLLIVTLCLLLFAGGLICVSFYYAMIGTDTPRTSPGLMT